MRNAVGKGWPARLVTVCSFWLRGLKRVKEEGAYLRIGQLTLIKNVCILVPVD